MDTTATSFLIVLFMKACVANAQNDSTDGAFFCIYHSPHYYQCMLTNYSPQSKWLIFNDTLSTMLNLYRMEIYGAGDSENLLESIFKNYKYINDFTMNNYFTALKITEKTFENAFELKRLSMARSHIKSLDKNMFKNMRKIESFDVSENFIESIDPKMFQGLKSLTYISFYYNRIHSIEKGTFDNLKLISLILEGNKLTDFDFEHLSVSNDLALSANNLKGITEKNFTNELDIKELTLINSKITTLTSKFLNHFKNLEKLDIQSNLIEYLQAHLFAALPNLKYIDFTKNKIAVIEKGTFCHLNISVLFLDDNNLVEFDFKNITADTINLSSNLLTGLTINGNVQNVIAFNNSICRVNIVTRTLKDLGTDRIQNQEIKYV